MNYLLEGEALFAKITSRIKKISTSFMENDWSFKVLESKLLLYFVVLLLLVKIITVSFYIPFPKNIFFADITKIDLTNLLNKSRESMGLNALTENPALDQAAQMKAQDMIKNGYFAHQSPSGVTPWFWFGQAGYVYKYAGENLAIGFINSADVYNAWLNSPSHKANLLNSHYKEVGTAVVSGFGGNDTTVVVQLFGSPLIQNPSTASSIVKAPTVTPTIKNPAAAANPLPDTSKTVSVAPTPKPSSVNPQDNTVQQKVLSQTTENLSIVPPQNGATNGLYYQFLNFIVYHNANLFGYIAYAMMLLIAILLFVGIMKAPIAQHQNLIFRSLLLVGVLYAIGTIDGSAISQIFAHQVFI